MFKSLDTDKQQQLEKITRSRQLVVERIDEIRTNLQKKYGEFPDSVELIREDRDR